VYVVKFRLKIGFTNSKEMYREKISSV